MNSHLSSRCGIYTYDIICFNTRLHFASIYYTLYTILYYICPWPPDVVGRHIISQTAGSTCISEVRSQVWHKNDSVILFIPLIFWRGEKVRNFRVYSHLSRYSCETEQHVCHLQHFKRRIWSSSGSQLWNPSGWREPPNNVGRDNLFNHR